MEETLERIYTIPLRTAKHSPRNGRADRAIRQIRTYLTRHMKAEEVWIDAAVNREIWGRGKFTIPSKIRVRARLFDDGVVEVSLPEEETKAGGSMREEMAEAKERKLEETHKGEAEAAERAMAEGAAAPSGVSRPVKTETEEVEEDGESEEDEKVVAEAEEKAPAPAAKSPAAPKPSTTNGEDKDRKDTTAEQE